MVTLSEITTPLTPTIRAQVFSRRHTAWIVATFIFTILTASILSYTGYLATDPFTAAIDGFLVASVYVGWRVLQAYRVVRLRMKMQSEA